LVTKILTNLSVAKKSSKKEGVVYRSPRIYLPTKLTDDSSFPFLEGDELLVKIQDQRLVVELSGGRKKGSNRGRSAKSKGRLRERAGRTRKGFRRPRRQGLKQVSGRTRR